MEPDVRKKIEEMKGASVLIYEEEPKVVYKVYRQFISEGMPGLCISATFPAKLKKLHKFESEVIWISESSEKGAIKPGRMEFELMREVALFLKNNKGGVLLLDCIETLILENGFDKVVKFLKKVGDMAAVNGNTLLAVVNDQSMEKEKLSVLSKNFDMKLRGEELEAKIPEKVEKAIEEKKEAPGVEAEEVKEKKVEAKEEVKAEKPVVSAAEVKEERVEAKEEVRAEKPLVSREAFTNGLRKSATAKEAYTNGLKKQKPGFVNGLHKPGLREKEVKASRRRQMIAGAVVALIAVSIFAVYLLSLPTEKIKVDGNLEDWAGLPVYKDTEEFANPDIRLTEYSVYYAGERVYFYAKVAGSIFNGANNGYDVLTVFIDKDGNAGTGYRIDNIGAEAKIELGGYNGNIYSASLFIFREGSDSVRPEFNYTAWENAGGIVVEKSNDLVEGYAKITGLSKPLSLVVARHIEGNMVEEKRGMALVGKASGSLVIYQNFVGNDVVNSGETVLELRLIAKGSAVHIEGLSVANATVDLNKHDIAVNEEVVVECRAKNLTAGSAYEFKLDSVQTDVPYRIVGNGGKAYFASLPQGIVIDGAFGDWGAVSKGNDTRGDASTNIDLVEYATAMASDAYFYMAVDGTMLAGCEIPALAGRPQPGPPGPIVLKENLGLDIARVYIDLMNSTINTFNPAMISHGYLIELQGRNGVVISAKAYKWENGRIEGEIKNASIAYGISDGKIELSVSGSAISGIANDTKFYFEMTNWAGQRDASEYAYTSSLMRREDVVTALIIKNVSPLQTRQPIWIYGNITPAGIYYIRLTNLNTGEVVTTTSDSTGYFATLMDNPGAEVGDIIRIEVFTDPSYTNQLVVDPSEKNVTADDMSNTYIGGPAKDMSTTVAEIQSLLLPIFILSAVLCLEMPLRRKYYL